MMRRLGPLALVALQGWACGETRLLDGFSEGLSRIRLAPSEFIGSVPCLKNTPGALQTYVVGFREVAITGADAGSAVAAPYTSGAVPCDQAVIIPGIAGRFYAAEVLGFDDSVSDGERTAQTARWSATCGSGSAIPGDAGLDPHRPTISVRGVTVAMRGCTSFFGGAAGGGQLVVDQRGALGTRVCGQAAGEVSAFRGTLDGVTRSATCGEPLVFDVVGPERYHTIELIAYEAAADPASPVDGGASPAGGPTGALPDASVDAGNELDASVPPLPVPAALDAGASDAGTPAPVLGVPRWSTRCIGRSLSGAATPAYCDPLVALL